MVEMTYKEFDQKVTTARKKLQNMGLVAFDGSGDQEIENVFILISFFRANQLILR